VRAADREEQACISTLLTRSVSRDDNSVHQVADGAAVLHDRSDDAQGGSSYCADVYATELKKVR
jgi:hypothetical protein